MANLNQMPVLQNQKGFSMHDLSHYFGFKCSTGHIVPLETDILNPNERIRLKADMFVRMQPLVTPAMVDIDVDIHYFFVPLQMLDINFGRKWSQTREIFTSMVSSLSDASNVNKDLIRFSVSSSFIVYRHKKNGQGIDPAGVDTYTSANCMECYGSRIFRLFDYFGLNPYLSLKGGALKLDSDDDYRSVTDPINDDGSVAPQSNGNIYGNTFDPYLFYYQILAYNAIWQYWYRLEDRDKFDNFFFNIDRFNNTNSLNWVWDNLFAGDTYQAAKMLDMAGIKYAPNRKDYFTSSFRAPVINGLNFLQGNSDTLIDVVSDPHQNPQYLLNSAYTEPMSVDGRDYSPENGPLATIIGYNTQNDYTNTQTLRLMQAKEKYMNILGRLPRKNYDNLVYALFGENVPHDIKHELSHLGHDHFTINIGQVTSLASTSGAPLGELAGTGVGSSKSKGIKFTAPVHGVVMAVSSIVPRRMYLGGMLRKNYITTLQDFYNPVYDNLGMQPIYAFELAENNMPVKGFPSLDTAILGWQFRYEQWKRSYDRVNHAFAFGNERSWFNTTSITGLNGLESDLQNTQEAPEMVANAKQPLLTTANDFFYCRPDVLNEVMAIQYSVNWIEQWLTAGRRQETGNDNLVQADLENWYLNPSLIYARDPFICLAHIDYTKFSKMSDYGLVRFD